MKLKLNKSFRDAFGFRYSVAVKVVRQNPDFYPWELAIWSNFKVTKMDKGFPGLWNLCSWDNDAERYLMEKYGKDSLYFNTERELRKTLCEVIRDKMCLDYSGDKPRPFVFAE